VAKDRAGIGLKKAIVKAFDEDIVVIRHRYGCQIHRDDIRDSLRLIQKDYPDRRLLLVDHEQRYDLDWSAVNELDGLDYFRAIAVLTYSENARLEVEGVCNYIDFPVPFEVFDDLDEALDFLHKASRGELGD
jgi:hypothetical protein